MKTKLKVVPITVPDVDNPVGEEKRIIAAMKSFGSRHATNVKRDIEHVLINGTPYIEVVWSSGHGEFNERSWGVSVLFDIEMRTPNSLCVLTVTSNVDGSMHYYLVPRNLVDRFLSQRLGNDYVPHLHENFQDFWIEIGGHKQGDYYTVPASSQWGLGHFGFKALKDTVASELADHNFMPTREMTLDEYQGALR